MTDITDGPVPMDLRDPAELLSFVPYEFNFQPQDSLVIVSVTQDGDGYRLGHSARISLDHLVHPREGGDLRRHVVAVLEQRGITGGFLIIYNQPLFALLAETVESDTTAEEAVILAQHLITWFDHEYFHPERTFVVGEEAWRCLSCRVDGHCPPDGRRRSELKYTAVAASMVARGEQYRESREDLVRLPRTVPPGTLTAPVRALVRTIRRGKRRLLPSEEWLVDSTRLWNEFLLGPHPSVGPEHKAMLALSLHSLRIRDNVIYAMCTGLPVPDPTGGDDHFTSMFKGAGTPRDGMLIRARETFQDLAEHCPADLREPVLSVWAWCAWWAGQTVEAKVLVEMALGTRADYSLALTLRSVTSTGALPPWLHDQGEQQ